MDNIQQGTGQGLVEFLEYAEKKGLMNATTARAYRSAVAKILSIDDNDVDLRQLDIDEQLDRFERISGHNYTPGSLTTYRARFKSAADMYFSYLEDPSGFKAPTPRRRRERATALDNGVAKKPESTGTRGSQLAQQQDVEGQLHYPFPLRSGDTAHLHLPRNLSTEDVERLSAFLKSLAIDPPLQLPSGDDH